MNKKINIVPDPWLKNLLGRDVYRLAVDKALVNGESEAASAELSRVMAEKGVFLYAKVATHDIRAAGFLEKKGFYLVDTNVVFEGRASSGDAISDFSVMRFADKGDEEGVAKVAATSFVYSRFHLDPAFSAEAANRIKSEWTRNFFNGGRGDAMVIALCGDTVAGFSQLFCGSGILIIDQIAVSDDYQRQGIGRSMVLYAQEHCGGIKSIRVGTQISNIPAMRLYENLGLKVSDASYIFHYHNLRR